MELGHFYSSPYVTEKSRRSELAKLTGFLFISVRNGEGIFARARKNMTLFLFVSVHDVEVPGRHQGHLQRISIRPRARRGRPAALVALRTIAFLFVSVRDGEAACHHLHQHRRHFYSSPYVTEKLILSMIFSFFQFLFVSVRNGEGQIYAYCTNICLLY